MNMAFPEVNFLNLLPEGILLAAAAGTLFLRAGRKSGIAGTGALAAVASSLILALFLYRGGNGTGFDGLIVKDDATLLFLSFTDLAAFIAVAFSGGDTGEEGNAEAFYGLILFALLGIHVMVSARDLLVIFLGLEILALPLYVLVGFDKKRKEGMEGAVKYFLLGSFSSALYLMGMALCYGVSGTTGLGGLSVPPDAPAFLLAGLALVTAGMGFKTAAVPFHMWAPDVYEGAPLSVAAFISVAPKIAAFAVLLRVAFLFSGTGMDFIPWAVLFMSGASMVVGNLAALRQRRLVRMLAYSGIAQVGYILLGFPAFSGEGPAAVAFYLFVYIFMNLGAFATAAAVAGREGRGLDVGDLSGLASRRPFLAFAMSVFMISLAGLPPTGGFFAKFFIFKTALEAGWLPLVLLAVVMTVVSLFYYLRVVVIMYMSEGKREAEESSGMSFLGGLVTLMVLVTLAAGTLPSGILKGIQAVFP